MREGERDLGIIGPDTAITQTAHPGERHTYIVTKPNYRTRAVKVEVPPGVTSNLLVSLEEITNAPTGPVYTMAMIVVTNAGLEPEVTLDDTNRLKNAPYLFTNLALGGHTVRIEAHGYETTNDVITVGAAGITNVYGLAAKPGTLTIDSRLQNLPFTVSGPKSYKGQTPTDFSDVPSGTVQVVWTRTRFPAITNTVVVANGEAQRAVATFAQGTLEVTCKETDADIMVDGEKQAKAPFTLELPPGDHKVDGTYKDFPPASYTVTLSNGVKTPFEVDFPHGVVLVDSSPEQASIKMGGADTGFTTPHTFTFVKPGATEIELDLPYYLLYRVKTNVEAISASNSAVMTIHGDMTAFANVSIASDPPGADVQVNGQDWGPAPVHTNVLGSTNRVELRLAGYKAFTAEGVAFNNGDRHLYKWSLTPSAPPTNAAAQTPMIASGCGMTLRKIDGGAYAGVFEVTEGEYHAIVDKSAGASRLAMRGITWEQASHFCALLTALDQANGRIQTNQQYAPPTTNQWAQSLLGASPITAEPSADPAPVEESGEHIGFYGLASGLAEWCRDASADGKSHYVAEAGSNGYAFQARQAGDGKPETSFRCVLETIGP